MRLYELSAQLEACVKDEENGVVVDTETGEVFDPEAFEKLEGEFEKKCLDLARWTKNLDAERKAVYDEMKKLDRRQKALSRKKESIENYLSSILQGRKLSDENTQISYRKSDRIEVNFDAFEKWELSSDYLKYAEPTVDKASIKKMLKEGKEIPGCMLVENLNLQIK